MVVEPKATEFIGKKKASCGTKGWIIDAMLKLSVNDAKDTQVHAELWKQDEVVISAYSSQYPVFLKTRP
eukprot:747916-Hanusia_phi.AAC.3